MEIDLGRSVAEYEGCNIHHFFEIPPNYKNIINKEKWLIVGRKGSGKSTLVDYRVSQNSDKKNICFRPGKKMANLVLSVYEGVSKKLKADDKIQADQIEEEISVRVSNIIHFIVHVEAMKSFILGKEDIFLTGKKAEFYTFLRKNNLIKKSAIYSSIKFIRKITKGLKYIDNLAGLLDDECDPGFDEVQEDFYEFLKEKNTPVFLYIDNIDDYGFDYSIRNRSFFNALVSTTMQINNDCIRDGIPFRVILTIPTELYDNTRLWNRDKVKDRSTHLTWNEKQPIKNLLCKRIAIELNVRKNKPRYCDDIFSISTEQTWDKLFPMTVLNKMNRSEDLFSYLIRHTLYTPRNMLSLCSEILNSRLKGGGTLDDWEIFNNKEFLPKVVERESIDISKSILAMYEKMYKHINRMIQKLKGRPNIWLTQNFENFIENNLLNILEDRAKSEAITDKEILFEILYKMGLIGLGFNTHISPPSCENYELYFSYLNTSKSNNQSDIIVISPIFYDYIGINPDKLSVIVPDKNLLLNPKSIKAIRSYDHKVNFYNQ